MLEPDTLSQVWKTIIDKQNKAGLFIVSYHFFVSKFILYKNI